MAMIQLTHGGETLVDDWLYHDLLAMGPWRRDDKGYAVTVGNGRHRRRLHRIILEMAGYVLTGLQVDHINGTPLDNRLVNLRPATSRQNQMNRGRLLR